MPNPLSSALRKAWIGRLVAVAKLALFALVCWSIYYTFVSGNEALRNHTWHVTPGWLVVAGLFYLLGMLPAAVFWHRVLLRTGQQVKLSTALRAYYISQLGKYVPGKWMVIVLRRTLLPGPGIENTVVAATVFYETFTMLAVGAAVSAVVLVAAHRDQMLLVAAALGSAPLLGVPTVPSIFKWLMGTLGVGKLNPTAASKLGRVGPRLIAIGWLTIAGGWILQGVGFWATLRAMDEAAGGPLEDLALHTAAVALGVVAGFISQIPGGLGAREWVSAELMEPRYGPGVAIVSAILFRLVLLVSEVAISIILYLVGWRPARKAADTVDGRLQRVG